MREDDRKLFDLFWENSKFDEARMPRLQKMIDENDPRDAGRILEYPGAPVPLHMPEDSLQSLFNRRKSGRVFSDAPLTARQLGGLFAAFAEKPSGHRVAPSAGGKFPVHTYAFLLRAQPPFDQALVYHQPDAHALTVVGDCPPWEQLNRVCNAYPEAGQPAAVFVFTGFIEQTGRKYGARAGRFMLQECGHYAQNLALRMAEEGLQGYECGGVLDNEMKRLLGLEGTSGYILLAMLCGK